jgi:hypothetical protein
MACAIVKSRVTNPSDLRIEVSVELGLPQWKDICRILRGAQYYAPLDDIRNEIEDKIRRAAENVDSKVVYPEFPPPDSTSAGDA